MSLSEGRVEGVELVCDEHRSSSRGVDSQACGGRSKLFDDRFDQQAADSDAHLRAAATDPRVQMAMTCCAAARTMAGWRPVDATETRPMVGRRITPHGLKALKEALTAVGRSIR